MQANRFRPLTLRNWRMCNVVYVSRHCIRTTGENSNRLKEQSPIYYALLHNYTYTFKMANLRC